MHMTREQLAYFAGFFDGEGHATIRVQRNYTGTRRINWNLWTAISQVKPTPLELLHAEYGGTVLKLKNWKTHRPLYRWAAAGPEAAKFLSDIQHWLIVKADVVALCLEFQKHVTDTGRTGRRGNSEEIRIYRFGLYQQVRLLNQRGIPAEPSIGEADH